MKKTILLLIILICGNIVFAQKKLSETEKLVTTAKIWGFLKYYHPEVAQGTFNWDEELFKILPKIEKVNNKESLSTVYLDWIETLGKVKKCKNCEKKNDYQYFDENFDLSWINNNQTFTTELSQKLKFIEQNRNLGKNYYVSVSKNVGNIEIINEPKYENFEYPNKNYRLLCLFRYWNIIEYFFPYKYLTDQNWDDVLSEMISKFKDAKDATSYHLAMLELAVKIDDSHSRVFYTKQLGDFFGKYGVPIKYRIINNKAVITGFYYQDVAKIDDLKIGDAILEVNNISVLELLKLKSRYIPASNINGKQKNSNFCLFLGNTKKITIKFERKGVTYEKIINRYDFSTLKKNISSNDSTKWEILKNNIGYVNMKNINGKDSEKMMKSLLNCKAIIFDLRNYPAYIFRRISRYLNPTKQEFVKIIKPDLSYPGKFIWKDKKTTGIKNKDYYKGKVILLVNENTISRAEYTVMSLQTAPNVLTIGNQTAGADGTVSSFEFVGGYKTSMTSLGVYYPDYSETQRKGIKIDIEIKPTIEGISKGKDELLDKAIELANE